VPDTAAATPPESSPEAAPDPATDATPSAAEPEFPIDRGVEALLIGADRPLPENRLADLLGLRSGADGGAAAKQVREIIEKLNAAYAKAGHAFAIERLAGGWQILTRPEYGPLLSRLHRDRQQARLSQAALETLAIISYRQPIMRAEIEAIRGVSCGEVLRGLLERRLVKIAGRAEELGRPMLYGTTKEFLKVFGLAGLDDLPPVEGLEPRERSRPARRAKADEAGAEAPGDAAADAPAETPAAEAGADARGEEGSPS
jgi:segregation and condensation protein B